MVCCTGYVNMVFEVHLCRQNPNIKHPKLRAPIIAAYQTTTDSLFVLCYIYIYAIISGELPALRNHFHFLKEINYFCDPTCIPFVLYLPGIRVTTENSKTLFYSQETEY